LFFEEESKVMSRIGDYSLIGKLPLCCMACLIRRQLNGIIFSTWPNIFPSISCS